jgi:membrane fusion protein (multidrug efflux system)
MVKKRVEAGVLLFVCAAWILSFAGCEKEKAEPRKKDMPVPVILGRASSRTVEHVFNQVGTFQASREVTLRSEIDGKVVEILFEEGKKVEKGDVLIRLDAAKIRAGIRSIEAGILQLKVRLENRVLTLERNRQLLKQDAVSRQHFDNLESEINEIKAQISASDAELARQKELLSYTVIRAPFRGTAGAKNISEGHYCKVGDPLVTIVTLDPLEICFPAPEKLKSKLFIGQDVHLSVDAFPLRIFKGTIFFISPQVSTDTRCFQVKARVANKDHALNPGMFARAKVITGVRENALTVPWESVIQTEAESYVYAVNGDVARKVPVRLGQVTSEWAEVVNSDLSVGSKVILEGKYAVKDGMKVSVVQNTGPGQETTR